MERMLILGGTGWLGRAIASAALDRGWQVSCLARGTSGEVAPGAGLVRAYRSELDAHGQVRGPWEAVVDLTSDPVHAGTAAEAIGASAEHWIYVSSISVYSGPLVPGSDESAVMVEPKDLSQYPDAKVAAERATAERIGDRLLIVRPGLIAGPGDPSDRFGYWPARFSCGGTVLTPEARARRVQVIDVEDLAAWIVDSARVRRLGVVDAVGPSIGFAAFLERVAGIAGFDGGIVTADDEALAAAEVVHWAGPRSLPLWLPAELAPMAQRSGERFLAEGGSPRPIEETIRRVLEDELSRSADRPRASGLSAAEEAEVLERVREGAAR